MPGPADCADPAARARRPGNRLIEARAVFGNLKLSVVRAQDAAPPLRLLLLLHGYGSGVDACLRLPVEKLANNRTAVALVEGPLPGPPYGGRAWCRLSGSEEQRRDALHGRADDVDGCLRDYLAASGAPRGLPEVLPIGFSQGGSLALALGLRSKLPIRRVISIAGTLPPGVAECAPNFQERRFHLIHGSADRFVPAAAADSTCARLRALGCPAILERVAGAHHFIEARTWRAVRRGLACDPSYTQTI